MSRRGRVFTAGYVVVAAGLVVAGSVVGLSWFWPVTVLTLPVGVVLYLPLLAVALVADLLPGNLAAVGTPAAMVVVVAAMAWCNVLFLRELGREARWCRTERAARRRRLRIIAD